LNEEMKKYAAVYLLMVFMNFTFAVQAQEYTIQWDDTKVAAPSKIKQRLSFEQVSYDNDNFAYFHLSMSGKALDNVVVVPLETKPLENPSAFYLPSLTPKVRSEISFYKGSPVTLVHFMPILINASGGVDKIIRFKLEYREVGAAQPARTLNRASPSLSRSARTAAASGSVLASGSWYKVPITKEGIHKMDFAYLQSLGINPATINPRQIRLFGNGGGMLPQLNSAPRYDDLIENAIVVVGEQDGQFNEGDYILFYAKAPHTWTYDAGTGLFTHVQNVYSDQAYYFLNVGSANGARVSAKSNLGSAAQSFNYFDDREYYEKDQTSIIKSGREWYGEKFGAVSSTTIPIAWEGARAGSQIRTDVAVLGRAFVPTSFAVRFNELSLGSMTVGAMGNGGSTPLRVF
jgi:hypothetical protein